MISRDIAVVDCHPEQWIHLVRGPGGAGGGAPRPWLILVHEQERIVHAVLGTRPRPDLVGEVVGDLAARRRELGAGRVVCLEQDFLRRTFNRAESRLDFRMDYVEQLLTLIAAFRAERGTGLRLEPPSPPGPVPPFKWVQFLFDRLWPDDTSIALHVVDEAAGELWASLILRKRAGDLDLVTTDLYLGEDGLRAGSWRADRARCLDALTWRVARPYLAATFTLEAWRAWRVEGRGLGVLRRAGGVVLGPLPWRLRGPLAVAGALRRLRS